MTKVDLLTPHEYIADAAKQARQAKHRIVLLAMVIADHSATHELIQALLDARKRGVKVYVAADVFTYGEVSGSFLPLLYFSVPSRSVSNMGKKFKEAGVNFRWLGREKLLIMSGRTHSKWCIVDDTVYSFGGVNTYQDGIENVDFMLRIHSKKLADELFAEHLDLALADRSGRLRKSHQFDFDNDHVLIDGGILGNSIIYRRACDLASSAKSITFVSQYPPTWRLSQIMRTKKSKLYFNPPENASFINSLVIRFSMFRNNARTSYKKHKYLHAKFIIFYMADGSRVALTGSHNFNYTGVLLGTREIALETRNPHIIDQLEEFLVKKVI